MNHSYVKEVKNESVGQVMESDTWIRQGIMRCKNIFNWLMFSLNLTMKDTFWCGFSKEYFSLNEAKWNFLNDLAHEEFSIQGNPETPDKESKIKLGEYSTHPEATISLTTKLYFLSVTNNENV